ncbi:GOLPH3/VPS74 family protein [Cryptosporangium phraense]|nr:GPP34 family phosphoprotein [Cryptosporangium phraense]
MPAQSNDQLYLADDLWLIAHDRPGHKSWLSERALSVGLAGALLAELVLAERLTVKAGRLKVTSRTPTPDSLMHDVMAAVLSEPDGQDVRTWLEALAGRGSEEVPLRTAVPARLVRAGVLQREEHRGCCEPRCTIYRRTAGRAGRVSGYAARPATRPLSRCRTSC